MVEIPRDGYWGSDPRSARMFCLQQARLMRGKDVSPHGVIAEAEILVAWIGGRYERPAPRAAWPDPFHEELTPRAPEVGP